MEVLADIICKDWTGYVACQPTFLVFLLISQLYLLEPVSVPVISYETRDQEHVFCACTFHCSFEALGISPYAEAVSLTTFDREKQSVLQVAGEVLLDLICETLAVSLLEGGHQSLKVCWASREQDRATEEEEMTQRGKQADVSPSLQGNRRTSTSRW